MREIGKISLRSQRGAWGGGAMLCMASVSVLLSFGFLNGAVLAFFERPQVSGALFSLWKALPGLVSACLALTMLLAAVCVIAPLKLGGGAWHYGGTIRTKRRLRWIGFWFNPAQLLRAARLYISLAVRKMTWAIALLLPGGLLACGTLYISFTQGLESRLLWVLLLGAAALLLCGFIEWVWVIQRYAIVLWLAVHYPKIRTKKAISVSARLMDGKHWQSICFSLRLLPIIPLAILVLPLLWIIPYARQRRAFWARQIITSGASIPIPLRKA
jgi:hypothetical protein